MKKNYQYFVLNNCIYIRMDNRTHDFQFLNNEKMWENHRNLKNFIENSSNFAEINDEDIINRLSKFPNKINDEVSFISQDDFDKMNDIEKLKYMAQISKRTNYIFDNASLKQNCNH